MRALHVLQIVRQGFCGAYSQQAVTWFAVNAATSLGYCLKASVHRTECLACGPDVRHRTSRGHHVFAGDAHREESMEAVERISHFGCYKQVGDGTSESSQHFQQR